MQALILAGGEGTRLRPLTSRVPKPVVPLVDRPFIAYMIEWLKGHGVTEAILSCGFMAEGVSAVLGDGSDLGVELTYVQEPEPLGTGGALKFAEAMLQDRFLMLNGDVLTDIDLTAQLRQHEETGAKITLSLYGVEDPSAYGLVTRHDDCSVKAFVEKPRLDEIETNLISAGAYVIEREVLDRMPPAGTRSSVERDLFPELVGEGLYGYEATGYWMDIGTPDRYLQATYDILDGEVATEAGRSVAAGGGIRDDGSAIRKGRIHPPALIGADCVIERDATVSGRTVLGRGVTLAAGAHVESSVLLDGCRVGAGTRIVDTIVASGVTIGERCRIDRGVVIGQDVTIGDDNVLTAGMRIFPGVNLPDGAVAFLSGDPLDREAIGAVDPSGQLADILDLPEHLRDALWRVESANVAPQDSPGGFVVAGMGGSAIGADLAFAVLGDRASRPVATARGYALPSWTTPDATVLCSSYSGETEETLAAFDAAGAVGARRIVCTTGGALAEQARDEGVPVIPLPGAYQPRAAVGYALVVALEVAALAGVAEGLHTEIDVAAVHAERLMAQWGPGAAPDCTPKALAHQLHGTIPQIAGAGLTAPIAYRWKTQINENAKLPCFASELPELDHNEIVGWEGAAQLGRFSAVFLDDSDLHPRVKTRIALSRELIEPHAAVAVTVASVGETRMERLVSLVVLGDLVSLYLAVLRGVDPAQIATLDKLKATLATQ